MNNQDIHVGLKSAEMRDLLSKQYEICFSAANYMHPDDIRKKIEELEQALVAAETLVGIRSVLEMIGWERWDCSEDVPYDRDKVFCFVGTAEEFRARFPDSDQVREIED